MPGAVERDFSRSRDDNETNTAPCISEVEFRYYVNWRMDLARDMSESYDSSIG